MASMNERKSENRTNNSTYILVIFVSPLKESFETIVKLFLFKSLQDVKKVSALITQKCVHWCNDWDVIQN